MNSKKYIPSFGFFILLSTIISTVGFFYWVENAVFNAFGMEDKAHVYYSEKKYSKAYENFLESAELSENSNDKSRRYRCAANAAHAQNKIDKALDMLGKSLKYNKNNENAIALLKAMENAKQISKEDIKSIGADYK